MKITVAKLLALNSSIAGIVVGREVLARRNNEDVVTFKPYDIDADTFMKLVAIDETIAPQVEAYNKASRNELKKILEADGAPPQILKGSREEIAALDAFEVLQSAELDLDIGTVETVKLKLDSNPEMRSLVPGLRPILV